MILKKAFCFIILLGLCSAVSGAGLPLTRGTAARPLALGNSFVGQADDAAACFLNPAGPAFFSGLKAASTYSKLDDDTTFAALAVAKPELWGGAVGVGARIRSIANVQVSAESITVSDQEFIFSYARLLEEQISFGAALRLASEAADRSVAGYQGSSGRSLDLGINYHYLPWLQFGLAAQNLGGVVIQQNNSATDVDQIFTVGASVQLPRDLRLNLAVDKEGSNPFAWHLGAEFWLMPQLALRAGVDQVAKNFQENYSNLTTGIGIKLSGFTFDYALYKYADVTQDNLSYFSFGYVGPDPLPPPPAPLPAVTYPTPGPQVNVATKLARAAFKDLPAKHWAKEPAELLATAGLLEGFSDGTFRPEQKINREQFAKMLVYAKKVQSLDPLRDVGGNLWVSAPAVLVTRAEAANLLGLLDKVSRPTAALTRGEFAVLLAKTTYGQIALKRLPPLD